MSDPWRKQLEEEVDLLRAAVSELQEAQRTNVTREEIAVLRVIVERRTDEINERLDGIYKILKGSNGESSLDVLTTLTDIVQDIGGVLEKALYQSNLKTEVIEGLTKKLSTDKIMSELLSQWQSYAIKSELESSHL
jgi:hypothetical protein